MYIIHTKYVLSTYYAGTVLSFTLTHLIFKTILYVYFILILIHRKKLRHREGKKLAQSHPAGMWNS